MYTGPIGSDRVFRQSQHRWYKIEDGPNSLQKDWLLGLYKINLKATCIFIGLDEVLSWLLQKKSFEIFGGNKHY